MAKRTRQREQDVSQGGFVVKVVYVTAVTAPEYGEPLIRFEYEGTDRLMSIELAQNLVEMFQKAIAEAEEARAGMVKLAVLRETKRQHDGK